jgi:hypothetical protein
MSEVHQPSDPNKPGTQTTEFKLTAAVSIVGAIIAGLSVTLAQLHEAFPTAGWIATAITAVGGLATVVATASKFIGSRTAVKTAQLQGQAAERVVSAEQLRSGNPGPPTHPPMPR